MSCSCIYRHLLGFGLTGQIACWEWRDFLTLQGFCAESVGVYWRCILIGKWSPLILLRLLWEDDRRMMVIDDGWRLLNDQWWICLVLMVDNGLANAGWTGNKRRKVNNSILGINWAWDLLYLWRVDGDSRGCFILTRLNGYMDIMLRRTAVDLPIFDHTHWIYDGSLLRLIGKAFPLDLALQLSIEIAKSFRSVEYGYTLWIGSDEEVTFRPVTSLLISSAFNKLTILMLLWSNKCRANWTLVLYLLWYEIDWLFDLRHKMHHIARRRLYRWHWYILGSGRGGLEGDICRPMGKSNPNWGL